MIEPRRSNRARKLKDLGLDFITHVFLVKGDMDNNVVNK